MVHSSQHFTKAQFRLVPATKKIKIHAYIKELKIETAGTFSSSIQVTGSLLERNGISPQILLFQPGLWVKVCLVYYCTLVWNLFFLLESTGVKSKRCSQPHFLSNAFYGIKWKLKCNSKSSVIDLILNMASIKAKIKAENSFPSFGYF